MENIDRGVIAIITNNSFYDGINHRKMRQSLFESFDRIYILNLHGNGRIKEKAPDGSLDENVFDIIVGTGITIFIKDKNINKKEIFYDDLFGSRLSKYEELFSTDLNRNWKEITPVSPYYLFKPLKSIETESSKNIFSITDIFEKKGSAVKTDRDELFYDFSIKDLSERIKKLLSGNYDNDFVDKYNVENSGSYKLLEKIKNKKFGISAVTPTYYRPFDSRFIYYKEGITSRPNYELNKHLLKSNFCLISGRAGNVISQEQSWNLAFVTDRIVDTNIFYRGGGFLFPLYLTDEAGNRITNFTSEFSKFIESLGINSNPEEIFAYIYAILYSTTYRNKYSEFLKIDFPRIPFTTEENVFKQLSDLGNELINVHLLKESELDESLGEFIGKGDSVVEKLSYVMEKKIGKLYINKTQYFHNVPQQVYDFYIGGYQVLEKYLKDRKGRKLTYDEAGNVENIIRAIAFTIEQMNKIDELTKHWI